MEPILLTPISNEFASAKLPDERLRRRLLQISEAWDKAPGESLPERSRSSSALEATYRFLGNDRISAESVFEGHVAATIDRASKSPFVFVIHDTTEFRFGGEKYREGLGWLNSEYRQGFLAHFSICVAGDGCPLGSIGLFAWARDEDKKGRRSACITQNDPDRESLRWQDAALLAGERLHNKTEIIHLMDREGDSFELLSLMVEYGQRFVIRVAHDRRLEPGRGATKTPKLYRSLSDDPIFLEREVTLSAKAKTKTRRTQKVVPPRKQRIARLEIRAGRYDLFVNHNGPVHLPKSLGLNFVQVEEVGAPPNEEPVIWRLVTLEPIDTEEQVAFIVDAYRRRWIIEEFFKALKTGCRYQDLQLESIGPLLVALAVESAIAWRILLLRWIAQNRPDERPETVIPDEQLAVLKALIQTEFHEKLSKRCGVETVLLQIARLGGHIKNNGPPGWLVLRRGFDKLLTIQRGWELAKAMMPEKI